MRILAVFAALMILAVFLPAHSASALTVTLVPGLPQSYVEAWATDPVSGGYEEDWVYPRELGRYFVSATGGGNPYPITDFSWARTRVNLSNEGLYLTGEHYRMASPTSRAYSYATIHFSVDEDVPYFATGSYSVLGSPGSSFVLKADLVDMGTSEFMFSSNQVDASNTANKALTLGQTEADFINEFSGSLTGTLKAGHVYLLAINVGMGNYQNPLPAASATGGISLHFVPEPTGAALRVAALLMLGVLQVRRRSR